MLQAQETDWIIARPLMLLVEVAEHQGLDCVPLLQASGIGEADLKDPDNRLPVRSVFAAYERIAPCLGDTTNVLDIFNRAPVGHGSVIDYVFLCAADLEEGLENWQRFWSLRSNCLTISYERKAGHGIVDLHVPHHFGPSSQFTYGFVSLFSGRIEDLIGNAPPPFRVEIASKAPATRSAFQNRFGNRLAFEQERNRLIIPERYLKMTSASADPSLFRIIEAAALEHLDSSGRSRSQTSIIAAKINQGLRSGDCSIDYVAQALGMSNRSLQRTLEREGTNYRAVLDDVRRSVAERYLVDTNRPIKEIAFLLGFSEVSAFSRAVRNWFSMPPRHVRHRPDTTDA